MYSKKPILILSFISYAVSMIALFKTSHYAKRSANIEYAGHTNIENSELYYDDTDDYVELIEYDEETKEIEEATVDFTESSGFFLMLNTGLFNVE